MSTEATIRITFNNANAQANQLDSCAQQLRGARNQMDGILESLRREWQGEAANQYAAKCDVLEQKMNTAAGNLEQIANAIRQAAQAYYDAEMRALEIAREREAAAAAAASGVGSSGAGHGGGGGRG